MIYHATRNGVIISVIFWLSSLVILYFFLYWRRNKKITPVPTN
jgi:hypothetical protein